MHCKSIAGQNCSPIARSIPLCAHWVLSSLCNVIIVRLWIIVYDIHQESHITALSRHVCLLQQMCLHCDLQQQIVLLDLKMVVWISVRIALSKTSNTFQCCGAV